LMPQTTLIVVLLLSLSALGGGCSPAVTTTLPRPTGPGATPTPAPSAPAPTSAATLGRTEGEATIVAPAPPDCSNFGRPAGDGAVACAHPDNDATRLAALDEALTLTDGDALRRDQKLAIVEGCSGFEPGLIRALRADLAPAECADTIVEPLLDNHKSELSIEVSQVLRGLSLSARLLRASDRPPLLPPPFTREKFERFLNSSIRPWYLAQSKAVFDMAASGARLSGYGKAIVAIEAGLSDLRFVENVRKVDLPEDMRADPELVEVYQQSLEDALVPRKLRGRDAILVGLLHLGQLGVLADPRLTRARAELGKLFSGGRIDALDALLLPPLAPLSQSTVTERLAAKLPSFYADRVLRPFDLATPEVVRALLERGLPPRLRQQLEQSGRQSADVARLLARGQFELGCRYFRPSDFVRASATLAGKGVSAGPAANETRLIAALAQALEGGPENAVQLVLTGPMLPRGMGNVAALERLANGSGNVSGMSAFNAGHLLSIIPQDKPTILHWQLIARYFDAAERKLTDPAQKAMARARAQDARETVEHVRDALSAQP
jgi:hypothetical protein